MQLHTRRGFLLGAARLSATSLLLPRDSSGETAPPQLSWERDHPARLSWSTHLVAEVTAALSQLDAAQDIGSFFPSYDRVQQPIRAAMWAELVALLAFFESAWEPCARYHEASLGIDTVTHQPVFSEGLLQLSYQDMEVYPDLPFNWEKDRRLSPTDCRKTILDPLKNLSAGLKILSAQIQSAGRIVVKDNFYWSTLADPAIAKHSRVERIRMIAARWAGGSGATSPS